MWKKDTGAVCLLFFETDQTCSKKGFQKAAEGLKTDIHIKFSRK
jgi:hypothetical protein